MSAAPPSSKFPRTPGSINGSRNDGADEIDCNLDSSTSNEIVRVESVNLVIENNPSDYSSASSCDQSDNKDDRAYGSDSHNSSRQSGASIASLPSIFTADGVEGGQEIADDAAAVAAAAAAAAAASTVSTDQERQILLLMLLAQVCALHDATPRTFTVHVLELFERGILDRDSIHFLFELGLVPSISPTRALLTNGPVSPGNEETQQLALATTTTKHLTAKQRSVEACAIRSSLEQHEFEQNRLRNKQGGKQSEAKAGGGDSEGGSNATQWDVEHFPLSLSRYQREFEQISIISAGAFGQVYHVIRKMDGCDYAMKKVTFDATGYSDNSIDQVVREVHCLAKVSDHPNIVRYYTSWLEPGWMTGGSSSSPVTAEDESSCSSTPAHSRQQQQQQHRLVTDLQQLMKLQHKDTQSSHITRDDMDFSSLRKGRGRSGRQRRRFSFGSSVASADQSWGSYSDWSIGGGGFTFEESSIGGETEPKVEADSSRPNKHSYGGEHNRQGKQSKHMSMTPYRYQINLFIQMQLCHPASLADYIRERNTQIPEADFHRRVGPALDIFRQIAAGLAHVVSTLQL